GTKQFVSGHREFTINIALIEQGVPVFGLIYAPALDDFLVTDGPGRALRAKIEPTATLTALAAASPRPIHVRPPPQQGITALQSR
ncbi:inositol monophosphatase family protein, partial [Acinetobacter baumannii]